MNSQVTITEEAVDPELAHRLQRFRRNGEWLTEHGAFVFSAYRGKFIAVSEGEVFAADDRWEARRLAQEKHPDDEPLVQFIPLEKIERIYANSWPLASV